MLLGLAFLAGPVEIHVDADDVFELAGAISGAGDVRKTGPGTLIFSADNGATGTLTLEDGILVVNGLQPRMPIVVQGGLLGGKGLLGPTTFVGGALRRSGGTSILNVSGRTQLDAGSTFEVDINGRTAGAGYDQLNVAGAVNLNGTRLAPLLGFASAVGDQFIIINNDGTDPVAGTFDNLPEGTIFTLGSRRFQISYKGGSGNDVTLTHLNSRSLFPDRAVSTPSVEGDIVYLTGRNGDPDTLDDFILEVNWGDGTPPETYTFGPDVPDDISIRHRYLDDPAGDADQYIIQLAWRDQHGEGNSGVLTAQVLNAAPTAALAGPADGVRGQTQTFSLSANDSGPVDQAIGFAYTVNWGDGSPVQFIGASPGNGAGVRIDHVYADLGSKIVGVTATDKDGGTSETVVHTLHIGVAQVQVDPLDPSKRLLAVGGSLRDDHIRVSRGRHEALGVRVNSYYERFAGPIERIAVFGQSGDDDIHVSANIALPAWLDGGRGDDRLKSGGGDDVLLGRPGDDELRGGAGRDLLIGGSGADRIVGNGQDDILIAGTTTFDANPGALAAVMAEWTSPRDYQVRVKNLTDGAGSASRKNGTVFLSAGDTVHDDADRDLLSGDSGRDWFFHDSNKDKAMDVSCHQVQDTWGSHGALAIELRPHHG